MKDIVLEFKNFLYKERRTEDEKRELLRDLEEIARWGELTTERCDDKIRCISIHLKVRFSDKKGG